MIILTWLCTFHLLPLSFLALCLPSSMIHGRCASHASEGDCLEVPRRWNLCREPRSTSLLGSPY